MAFKSAITAVAHSPGDHMPRNSTPQEAVLALSPSSAARALGIRPERIQDAIDEGHLVVYQLGVRKRLLVGGLNGLEAWVQNHWKIAKRKVQKC
jgi:hypothetical protein